MGNRSIVYTDSNKRGQSVLGRGCGLIVGLIIIVSIVGGIGVAVAAVFAPNLLSGFMGGLFGMSVKQSQAISGDPAHFNPYKSYAEAHDFAAKDAQLLSITAYYVRSDGTMDLTASYTPAPRTEYQFVAPVSPPANAPPVGAGGVTNGTWYQPITITAYKPGQRESISESSGNTSFQYDFVNQGYSRETDDPTSKLPSPILPTPQCDLAQLWQTAIKTQDAPPNAVATIEYTASGYAFSISDTSVSLTFDNNCKVTNG